MLELITVLSECEIMRREREEKGDPRSTILHKKAKQIMLYMRHAPIHLLSHKYMLCILVYIKFNSTQPVQ